MPLDVSWHMPNSNRSALAEYLTGPRIPNARRFDLDEVAELDIAKNPLSLTHMLPSAETFQAAVRKSWLSTMLRLDQYQTNRELALTDRKAWHHSRKPCRAIRHYRRLLLPSRPVHLQSVRTREGQYSRRRSSEMGARGQRSRCGRGQGSGTERLPFAGRA